MYYKFFLKKSENNSLVSLPDLNKIGVLQVQIRNLIEAMTKEIENFSGNSFTDNEENLQKCDRIIYSLTKLCNKITSRHETSKDSEKYEQYMKYENLQHVSDKKKFIILFQ